MDGIRNMKCPKTGAKLQQFVCAMQWMRSSIPTFSSIIRPLGAFLEEFYVKAGKRTRLAFGKVSLESLGLGTVQEDAFRGCKKALEHQVTLAHVDYSKRLCIFTDASDFLWAGVVTQVPMDDVSLSCADQRHEPLAFLSGHFREAEHCWSTLEKEAYAIMATIQRIHWLLASDNGFDLFTDHNNLVFLFNPTAVVADLSQTTLREVLRWAVRLSAYNYVCVHIPDTQNVWADIIIRWTAPRVVQRLVSVPLLPSSSAEYFCWPTKEELATAQSIHVGSRPPDVSLAPDGLFRTPSGAIWIPDAAADIQLCLCVIAHTGPSGHRATTVTADALRDAFFWSTLSQDVKTFVHSCIHCLSTVGGGKIPRPFGSAVHGTTPNALLQFDYIEISAAASGEKYVLMLRDDHSNYCWLFSFPDTLAENAARAIIDWSAAFGVSKGLISDGPKHFKNETLRRVAKGLRVPHHFTLPHSPWSNGGVERLGKELLRVFRAVSSELRICPVEWPDLLPLVQSAINIVPSPQRTGIPPIKAFTGMDPSTPIANFYRSSTGLSAAVPDVARERVLNVESLCTRVAELHPIVQDVLQDNERRMSDRASKGMLPNFIEGDFVLVARDDFSAGEKLSLRWRGPRRVGKALNDYVYQVEELRNGLLQDVHATRLKFYHDESLDTEAIMPHVLSSETGMEVQRLMHLIETDDGLMVEVRWRGLPESDDTVEPLSKAYEDVLDLVVKLLRRKNAPKEPVAKARRTLYLN